MTTIYNYFCIKMIFLDFLKVKLQNAPNCTIKIFFPLASRKPPPNNSWPPLANPAYAHELLLRNLFENPQWQTVDCV